ncbi:MAG: Sua5/YciO/YrdC/YwlC family protein [Pseudomonadota bacterium]
MATPWQIRRAVSHLRAGGVIAYPTETVYGLGCDPLDEHAVERLLELKQRPREKGLILIGATLEQLMPYIDVHDKTRLKKLAALSERPTTWLCPPHADVPHWLTGRHHSIAVRITTSPVAQQLCQRYGAALISTSANPTGLAPARSALKVRTYFGAQLDDILAGQCDSSAKPSRIVDLISGEVIRE